jgi:hypothetical protein
MPLWIKHWVEAVTEQGADKAAQLRRSQANERNRLLKEIDTEQKKIQALNNERAPIAAEVRKVEAEVGPIKYIAALIYGDNPESQCVRKSSTLGNYSYCDCI